MTTVSLQQVLEAAYSQGAVITAQTAGYLALQALRALSTPPSRCAVEQLLITEEGRVEVTGATESGPNSVARSVRSLLRAFLLLVPVAPPGLQRVAERADGGLQHLEGELLAALVPLNPAASRRALARLVRECARWEETHTPTAASWQRIKTLARLDAGWLASPASASLAPEASAEDPTVFMPISVVVVRPSRPPAIESGVLPAPPSGDVLHFEAPRARDAESLARQFLANRPTDARISQGLLRMIGLEVRSAAGGQ
jgi:hypothetical protein